MMSILFKGVEMPKGCWDCPFQTNPICATNDILNFSTRIARPDNCPLIEVPPHGDLIDKDATMNEILEERGLDTACWFAGIVNDMPAVIPADKDGET